MNEWMANFKFANLWNINHGLIIYLDKYPQLAFNVDECCNFLLKNNCSPEKWNLTYKAITFNFYECEPNRDKNSLLFVNGNDLIWKLHRK